MKSDVLEAIANLVGATETYCDALCDEGDAEIRLRRLKRADSPLSEILAEKDRWYSLRSERVRTLNALLLAVNEYRYANKSAEEA